MTRTSAAAPLPPLERDRHRFAAAVRCSIVLAACCWAFATGDRLLAQSATWTSTVGGNWSSAANWNVLPTSDLATTLTFAGSGTQNYTATNDLLDPFDLNKIILNSTSSGTPTIAGAKLRFLGTSAAIRQDNSGAFNIAAPLRFDVPLELSGSGLGYVTLTGALGGMGGIMKSGGSTFVLGTPQLGTASSNTFVGGLTIADGTIRFADAQYSGPTALRAKQVRLVSSNATLYYGGTDAGVFTELRIGELFGVSGSTLLARTNGNSVERGLHVAITALGDADFAGSFSNTSNDPFGTNGVLRVRGSGNQSFSGPLDSKGDIEIYHGATVTLTNSASINSGNAGRIYLNGGAFTIDTRAMTGSNFIRDGSTSNAGLEDAGGGTFRYIGKTTTAPTELIGRLELSDGANLRAGAVRIELVHNAASGGTQLTFAQLDRQITTVPRTTIDFAAFDGTGATLALGQSGNNPRIVFTNGYMPINNLFSRTNSTGLAAYSGYATVNGTDFASHGANGVTAVTTTNWTGTGNANTNFRLTTNGNTNGTSSTFGASSLKLDATSAGLTLDISGTGNLQVNGILLAGANDSALTSSGGGGWIGVGTRFAHVQQAVLTVGASVADTNALVKAGTGALVLTNTANSGSSFILTLNEGIVRGSASTLTGGAIELRGGILELVGGGTFTRALGSGTASINWSGTSAFDRGSGGFAAVGAPVVIDLKNTGADDLAWRDTGFVEEGYALVFGSKNATARITLLDRLSLSEQATPAVQMYNARTIQVIDNPNSSADFARLAGVVSGDATEDLLKTGAGVLELSAANTYLGGTIVAAGTLLLADSLALGDPNAAYVLLAPRSGTADIALLTSRPTGTITIARDLLIQTGGTGSATIGNALAPDSPTTADALFSGNILVGLEGTSANKTVKLNAVSGTTVTYSGALTTAIGYSGITTVQKTGGGDFYLSGSASYGGGTTISAGSFVVAAGGRLAGGGGITVAAGATLKIAAGGQITGSGPINVSGSAPIDSVAVTRGTVIVDGTAGTSNALIVVGQGGLLQGNSGLVNGSISIERGGGIGPGDHVAKLSITGPATSTIAAGAHILFEVRRASGNTPGTDWDLIDFNSSRLMLGGIAGDPIVVHVDSRVTANTGHGANDFDPAAQYSWLFVKTGGLDLAASSGLFAERFSIVDDAAGAGVFGTGVGNPYTRLQNSFYVTQQGNDLYLNYAAVPEPGSLTLIGASAAAAYWYRRRKRPRS